MKKFLFLFTLVFGIVACSEENSSPSNPVVESGGIEFVEDLANHEYNKTDSVVTIYLPVCKMNSAGNLVWQEQGESLESKVLLAIKNYNPKTKEAKLQGVQDKESDTYLYQGTKFPYGLWVEKELDDDVTLDGLILEEKGFFKELELYQGDCIAKDFLPEIQDELEDLPGFGNFKYKNCSELTFSNGNGLLKINKVFGDAMSLAVSYKETTCDVSISQRYAFYEEDCKAAYEEYLADETTDDKFDFDEYDMSFAGDEECLMEILSKVMIANVSLE